MRKRKYSSDGNTFSQFKYLKSLIEKHLTYDLDVGLELTSYRKKEQYKPLSSLIQKHIVREDNADSFESVKQYDCTISLHCSCPAYFSEVQKIFEHDSFMECAYCESSHKRCCIESDAGGIWVHLQKDKTLKENTSTLFKDVQLGTTEKQLAESRENIDSTNGFIKTAPDQTLKVMPPNCSCSAYFSEVQNIFEHNSFKGCAYCESSHKRRCIDSEVGSVQDHLQKDKARKENSSVMLFEGVQSYATQKQLAESRENVDSMNSFLVIPDKILISSPRSVDPIDGRPSQNIVEMVVEKESDVDVKVRSLVSEVGKIVSDKILYEHLYGVTVQDDNNILFKERPTEENNADTSPETVCDIDASQKSSPVSKTNEIGSRLEDGSKLSETTQCIEEHFHFKDVNVSAENDKPKENPKEHLFDQSLLFLEDQSELSETLPELEEYTYLEDATITIISDDLSAKSTTRVVRKDVSNSFDEIVTRKFSVVCPRLEDDKSLSHYWNLASSSSFSQSVKCKSKGKGVVKGIQYLDDGSKICEDQHHAKPKMVSAEENATVPTTVENQTGNSHNESVRPFVIQYLDYGSKISEDEHHAEPKIVSAEENATVSTTVENPTGNSHDESFRSVEDQLPCVQEQSLSEDIVPETFVHLAQNAGPPSVDMENENHCDKKVTCGCSVVCLRLEDDHSIGHYRDVASLHTKSAVVNEGNWEGVASSCSSISDSDVTSHSFFIGSEDDGVSEDSLSSSVMFVSSKREKLSLSAKHSTCNLSLDKILAEIKEEAACKQRVSITEASIHQMNAELNSFHSEDLLTTSDKVLSRLPSHPIRITSHPPGLRVFDSQKAFCFFDSECIQLTRNTTSPDSVVDSLEKRLWELPLHVLLNVIECRGLERYPFAQLSEKSLGALLHFLLRVSAVHEMYSLVISCQNLMYSILNGPQTKWCLSLIDIAALLLNLGVTERGCPLQDIFQQAQVQLSEEFPKKECSKARVQPSLVFSNLPTVLRMLARLIRESRCYSATEYAHFVLLFCWLALDPQVSSIGMQVEMELCFKEALDKITDEQWPEMLEYLCGKLVELGNCHHHNMMWIAQCLPSSPRGSQLQRSFSFTAIQKLVGQEPVFVFHVLPQNVLDFLSGRKLHTMLDHYWLFNFFSLVDMTVSTTVLPGQSDALHKLACSVMETFGQLRENFTLLEASYVKNLLVEMRTKWMFSAGTLHQTGIPSFQDQ